jgi:hypothetical protein
MQLDFVSDPILRQRIDDAVAYIYTLYEESKNEHRNDSYRTETYRVIILYIVSIIEAILHYIRELRGDEIVKIEYKDKITISEEYRSRRTAGPVIMAVECKVAKTESEVSLRELIQALTGTVLTSDTAAQIADLARMRNSVHLRQRNVRECTIKDIEEALGLLVHTINHAPRHSRTR